MFHLERDDKMLAMLLYDNYVDRFKLLKTAAAAEVSPLIGMSEHTIRQWRKDFVLNGGEFSEYRRGKHQHYLVLEDEEYKEMAVTWVRANVVVKGHPNMTAAAFHSWVVSVLLSQVSITLKCLLMSPLTRRHAGFTSSVLHHRRQRKVFTSMGMSGVTWLIIERFT